MTETKFEPIPEIGDAPSSEKEGENKPVPSIYDQFATFDETAEEEGMWTDSIGEGMNIKIRAFTSRKVSEIQQRVMLAYADKQDENGDFPPDVATEMSSRVVAQGMVVDWNGPAFVDREGNPIEYSPEACYHFAKMSKKFRIAIYTFSMGTDNFKAQQEEGAVKNS
jgi:hypothetical protein